MSSTDRIIKQVELQAPVSRVWRALTDHREFGTWFGVKLQGPFEVGKATRGKLTVAGYEHVEMVVVVRELQPERLFAYDWHPYAIEPGTDYSKEPTTRVEFTLEKIGGGTLLRVVESGFDRLPAGKRRTEAFIRNEEGWTAQIRSIETHVRQTP